MNDFEKALLLAMQELTKALNRVSEDMRNFMTEDEWQPVDERLKEAIEEMNLMREGKMPKNTLEDLWKVLPDDADEEAEKNTNIKVYIDDTEVFPNEVDFDYKEGTIRIKASAEEKKRMFNAVSYNHDPISKADLVNLAIIDKRCKIIISAYLMHIERENVDERDIVLIMNGKPRFIGKEDDHNAR